MSQALKGATGCSGVFHYLNLVRACLCCTAAEDAFDIITDPGVGYSKANEVEPKSDYKLAWLVAKAAAVSSEGYSSFDAFASSHLHP